MIEEKDARARVGSVLNNKWTLEKLLGIGGMGAVYAARHLRNGARAAVKILHPDLARLEDVRERFLQEGRAANAVQHPGAVKVIDDDRITTGPDAGTTYLVMDLLDGESLEDRIERGPPVDERELLGILDAILDVLAAAHARGIVHRDLKPENLFLAKNPATGRARWMVLDFGLARLLDTTVITGSGMAVGTPAYMSPEQAAGRRDEIDGRADLFAIAATAFRVLTGRRVHEGGQPVEVVLKMASVPAPRVRDVAPQISEAVAGVIDRALAFRRDDRFPDAAAMRAAVQQAIAALDASAGVKTVVDVDAPTIVAPGALPERTVEISASELEPASGADLPSPPSAPVRREPRPSPAPAEAGEDAKPRPARRRRPSMIPIVTALFLAGLVVKLALDAEERQRAASVPLAVDASSPGDLASVSVPPPTPEIADAESERAPASEGGEDAGEESDARDAEGGSEETDAGEAAPDGSGPPPSFELEVYPGRPERGTIDSGTRPPHERRPPPSQAPAGAAHAGSVPPSHRPPPRGKPHSKHGD